MMRLGKDLIGKPIYSMNDGRHLGTVKDIYLDQDLSLMVGVFMGQEGLFKRKSIVIPRESINVFGVDAVLASDSAVVTDSNEMPQVEAWLRREALQGRPVDTPGGTKVGTVGDVLLDEDARVVGFALARVFVEGPIAETRVVMKNAVVDVGTVDGSMTIELALAEQAAAGERLEEVAPIAEAETEPIEVGIAEEAEDIRPAAAGTAEEAGGVSPEAIDTSEGVGDVSPAATEEAAGEEGQAKEPQNET